MFHLDNILWNADWMVQRNKKSLKKGILNSSVP